jgi:uncharacterized protein
MRVLTARNLTRQMDLGRHIRLASSLKDRTIGLLSTPRLAEGEGMYLTPCRSIHTFFMRYAIDVLFIDADGKVLGQETFRPWRLSPCYLKSRGVLELAEGTLAKTGTRIGDLIEMKDLN